MKTRTSWFAAIFQFIGYSSITIGIAIIVATIGLKQEGSSYTYLGLFSMIGYGGICAAVGNLIQKAWNIEYYLEILAKNSSPVITDYPTKRYEEKPIDALKAAVKPPAKPESDISKYAPK